MRKKQGRGKKHGGFLLGPIGLPISLALGPGRQAVERELENTMKRKAADKAATMVRNKIMGVKSK